VLGIDISPKAVSAVVVEQRLKRRSLTACCSIPHGGGETVAQALREAVLAVGGADLPCVSGLSARDLSFHLLDMPFTNLAKIRQVIAFELEPRLLSPLDEAHFDLCLTRRQTAQSTVLVAAIQRALLDHFLARFADHHPDLITVDLRNHALANQLLQCPTGQQTFAILDCEDGVVSLCHQGAVVLHRHLPHQGALLARSSSDQELEARLSALLRGVMITLHAFGVEQGIELSLSRLLLTGLGPDPVPTRVLDRLGDQLPYPLLTLDLTSELGLACRFINGDWQPQAMNMALALALRGGRDKGGFNFLSGPYQPRRRGLPYAREIRHGLSWAAVLLALLATQQGLEYRQLSRQFEALDQQTRAIFHRVFPAAQLKVDPLMQMRAAIKAGQEVKSGGGGEISRLTVLALLHDLSTRTSATWKVQLVGLVIDADTIQIKGLTDSFNTVDALKQELAVSPNVKEVTISSATLDRQNSVAFELRMRKAW